MKTEEKKRILRSAAIELQTFIEMSNSQIKVVAMSNGLDEPDMHDFQTCQELLQIAEEL